MTVRRFSAVWTALPLALGLALSAFAASDVATRDMTGVYQLLALPLAGILLFGGWERRRWLLAGVLTMLGVAGGAMVNAWVTVQLLISAGVPELWLLETSAALIVLGAPVALVSGMVTAVICNRGWFRRRLSA